MGIDVGAHFIAYGSMNQRIEHEQAIVAKRLDMIAGMLVKPRYHLFGRLNLADYLDLRLGGPELRSCRLSNGPRRLSDGIRQNVDGRNER